MRSTTRAALGLAGALLACAALAVEGDVVFKRKGAAEGVAPAYFPHWIHRIRYRCYACHDGLFKMKSGENEVTMEAMAQGKFCGACHNGTTAWGTGFDTCNRCHVPR